MIQHKGAPILKEFLHLPDPSGWLPFPAIMFTLLPKPKLPFMDASNFSNLNWLHVLVAALGYFVLGALWYSPLFGKRWVAYHQININAADARKGVAAIMFGSFIWMFITSAALAVIVSRLHLFQVSSGIKLGLLTGL